MTDKAKFEFPDRGFHLVADKAAEADYFVDQMKSKAGDIYELHFLFSAFVSAARSVTFSLLAVMSGYPDFDAWYRPRQERLQQSELARFFVDLRNHLQEVGGAPFFHSGYGTDGRMEWMTELVSTPEFPKAPAGEVISLSETYFRLLLEVLQECYVDCWAYVDPRALFAQEGLDVLGWAIDDVEEAVGFSRGWTDIPCPDDERDHARLKALSRYGGNYPVDALFEKYRIGADYGP